MLEYFVIINPSLLLQEERGLSQNEQCYFLCMSVEVCALFTKSWNA